MKENLLKIIQRKTEKQGIQSYKAHDNKQSDRRWISNTVSSTNTTGRFRNQGKLGIFTNFWKLNNIFLTNGVKNYKENQKILRIE